MSTKSKDFQINMNLVFEDELGIFFQKTNFEHQNLGKVRPSELGFEKKKIWEIYVYKVIENTESLENQKIYYSLELIFTVPEEKRYSTAFLHQAKSGKVFLKWFDSGTCSEVGINDKEFSSRGKLKRLPENTMIPKNAPIFRQSTNGELEREISDIW
jgi:hypothetical protein